MNGNDDEATPRRAGAELVPLDSTTQLRNALALHAQWKRTQAPYLTFAEQQQALTRALVGPLRLQRELHRALEPLRRSVGN